MKAFNCSVLAAAAALSLAGAAGAAISMYTGEQVLVPLGYAALNGGIGGSTHDDGGVHFEMSDGSGLSSYPYLYPYGGDGSQAMYNCNGSGRTVISRTDGLDLLAVELETGNGWGYGTDYLWVTAYNNGSPVADFNIDVAVGDFWGIQGLPGEFDAIYVGEYQSPGDRDQHNPGFTSCLMLDNVKYGTIPAPGAAALLGLGGLAAARRRRA